MFDRFKVSNVLILLFFLIFCGLVSSYIIRSLFHNVFTLWSVLSVLFLLFILLVPVSFCVYSLIEQVKLFLKRKHQ